MAQIKTIDTVAGENQIDFKRRYPFVWLKNLGDADVYISDKAGIVAEADGVVLLGAGQAAMLESYDDCVYVLGATTIEAHGQHSADSPFGDTIVAGGGGGGGGTIESLTVTQNGIYTASGGVDGYSPVTVEVPDPPAPVLIEKTITQNGVYDPEDDNADGYSMIDVEVPVVDVIELNANMNRTYTAPAGKAYSPVNVSVPGPSISKLTVAHNNVTYEAGIGAAFNPVEVSISMDTLNAPSNGVYEIDENTDGWDTVIVDTYEKYHELYTGGANMTPQTCYFNNDVNTDNYDEFWLSGQYVYTQSSNKNISIWNGRYPTSVLSSIYTNNGAVGSIGGHNVMWLTPDSTGKFITYRYYNYDYPYAFFGVKNKNRTEECLWVNTESTTPSTVTLSESIFDYDEICLYFVKTDGVTTTSWYLTDELSVGDIVQGYDNTGYPVTLNKYTIASNTTLTVLIESGGFVLMGVYGVNDTSLSETTLYANPDPTTAPATVTLSDSYANYDEIVLIGHVPSEDTVCSYYYPVKILGRWTHDAYRDRIGVFSCQRAYWLTFTSNTTLVADADPTLILDKIVGVKRPVVANAEPLPVKYIDDNKGIICYDNSGVSPIGFKNTDKLESGYISMPTDTAVTVEFCGVVSTNDTYGRIWQIGRYNSVGNTFAYDNSGSSPMFELAIHDSWDAHQIDAIDYLNTLITVSIVIDSDTKVYINGTLVSNAITFTKSDIVSDENEICFLHGTTSSRAADGDIYAFRIYHRALTQAEIQQNVQADIYNFGSTTVISE